jgi:protein SCO1
VKDVMLALFKTIPSLLIAAAVLCLATAARADVPAEKATDLAARIPPEIVNVGVTEHPGGPIPLDLQFIDDRGQIVHLSDYFQPGQKKPIILQLGYFQCPMLCTLVSQGLINSAKGINLVAGSDFDLLFVSIDPTETPSLAALKKQSTMEYYGKPEEAGGFHFMVGKPSQIDALADSVGFRYQPAADQQYAHPAVIFVLTPDGKISRYLYGTNFDPRTLRLSLVEASAGKIGTTTDYILLICLHYDSASGHYALAMGMLRTAAVITMLTLGGTLFWLFRRESRHAAAEAKKPVNGHALPALKEKSDTPF